MKDRQNLGLNILFEIYPEKKFVFLGEGKSSVVFHDTYSVYKVFILSDYEALSYKRHIVNTLQTIKDKFENSFFFYPIHQIIEINKDYFILIYTFEQSESCQDFQQNEIQDFLVECWQKRLIFQDIKPENFIRINQKLKWIDYEPDKFTDNLFLNMITRAFIYTKYPNQSKDFLTKLCRSAINNFELIELEGLQNFTNTLFAKIIFNESKQLLNQSQEYSALVLNSIFDIDSEGTYKMPYKDNINPEYFFWQLLTKNIYLDKVTFQTLNLDVNNYFSPKNIILETKKIIQPKQKVSLIIKACVQDAEIIYEAVKHIIRQISLPNAFDEKILALDIREEDFLRQFNNENTWSQLIAQAQKLVDESIIHKFIFPSLADISIINQKWFGISTSAAHTDQKIPVTAQLYAFEKANNDYILQMDCDVMIGRLSHKHSFLDDMIDQIEQNNNVLSVGFNIYKGQEAAYTPYFGFENGGFVPEVRFCLLKKSKIQKILPIQNEIHQNNFKLSWYRALERRQQETMKSSLRGGDSRSFYIHPQNFKKTDKDVWFTILDRVEQLQIPEKQINAFDLEGSYYDWTLAKRNEELVIISCFHNISLSRFLRFWYSLISQSIQDWGLILIDDASDNGISHFIKQIIKPFYNQITFIQNRFNVGVAQNTYKAIHYFMQNQQSITTIVDADDALIGKNALKNIVEKYTFFNADVVIGKMYRTDKLHPHYKYTPNFINPRLYGGNVWQHIRCFRKYLFDSLDFNDLKIPASINKIEDVLLSKRFSQKMLFPDYAWDFTYMVPIVEMSDNPIWINHFNLYHDRSTINTTEIKQRKNSIIAQILAKPTKSNKDIVIGRKTFLPNLNQIEIDITYECNLKCINCNRSSTQAPIKEGMSLQQINKFVEESIQLNKKWKLINLLGGEPTIHKDFLSIVDVILNNYIIKHSPQTILQVTSNGFGSLVQEQLSKLPNNPNLIIDYASFKDERIIPYFSPFNDAPIDNPENNQMEYFKGCWVTSYCGIGLNQLGYYPCGVAAGIDRILNFNLGISSLKDVDEGISKYLDTFCRYCGNFSDYADNSGNFIPRNEKKSLIKPIISETWKTAYKKYNKNKDGK